MNPQVSTHFTLTEFTKGRVTPTGEQYGNIVTMARWLEKLRAAVGGPLIISSGLRSAEKNNEVKGAEHSYHLYWGPGIAAVDIVSSVTPPQALARACMEVGGFDSVIWERADRAWPARSVKDGSQWVHVQLSPRPRGLTFTATPKDKAMWGNADKDIRPELKYEPGLELT